MAALLARPGMVADFIGGQPRAGGHLPGEVVSDLLLSEGQVVWMRSARIATPNTHGTGCTLSSAIAAHLAHGLPLDTAVQRAREYILRAIAEGAQVQTGHGHGPLNHGHAPVASHRVALA